MRCKVLAVVLLFGFLNGILPVDAAPANSWKTYHNPRFNVEFKYPANWVHEKCSAAYTFSDDLLCEGFKVQPTPIGQDKDDYNLLFEVKAATLENVLKNHGLFEKTPDGWVKHGRTGTAKVQPITGKKWQGIYATTICGISDQNGFHAAGGECLTAVLTQANHSAIFETDGTIPTPMVLYRIVKPCRFF